MSVDAKLKVSIGLPVYNAELHVARAVNSLLAQTCCDFELIISDNASTDRTPQILMQLAARDTRIRLVRQDSNLGAIANFGFVLSEAKAGYFMWAASDDHWMPEFVAENLAFLEANPGYVASVSQAVFDDADADPGDVMGTYALNASIRENLEAFISNPAANTRFYGVHRTGPLREAWDDGLTFWASDWAIVCRVLLHGKYHEVPRVLMMRSFQGTSSRAFHAICGMNTSRFWKAFPFLQLTFDLLHIGAVRTNSHILLRLLWLNVDGALMMLRKRWMHGRPNVN